VPSPPTATMRRAPSASAPRASFGRVAGRLREVRLERAEPHRQLRFDRRPALRRATLVRGRIDDDRYPHGILQILGPKAGVLGNTGQHPRPDLLTIVEGKDEIGTTRLGEDTV